ncbi:hypothetical protein ACIQPQ_31350 [Streptomyces sp. NPDC091281]|uniref:hypothetical protein n=1 Tax=Streptomyces sp. NPDC091281 TaxID=3365985 RepID=UPI0037F3BF16
MGDSTDFFEIVTTDGQVLSKGSKVPHGLVGGGKWAPALDVESFTPSGDWVDVHLSDGWTVSLPEAQIARIVTRRTDSP